MTRDQSQPEVHIEIEPNKDNLIFDLANERIKENCLDAKIDTKSVTSLKFHVNSWGLSSCNWFADEIVDQMKNLAKIDMSDTIGYENRSDMPLSIRSIL